MLKFGSTPDPPSLFQSLCEASADVRQVVEKYFPETVCSEALHATTAVDDWYTERYVNVVAIASESAAHLLQIHLRDKLCTTLLRKMQLLRGAVHRAVVLAERSGKLRLIRCCFIDYVTFLCGGIVGLVEADLAKLNQPSGGGGGTQNASGGDDDDETKNQEESIQQKSSEALATAGEERKKSPKRKKTNSPPASDDEYDAISGVSLGSSRGSLGERKSSVEIGGLVVGGSTRITKRVILKEFGVELDVSQAKLAFQGRVKQLLLASGSISRCCQKLESAFNKKDEALRNSKQIGEAWDKQLQAYKECVQQAAMNKSKLAEEEANLKRRLMNLELDPEEEMFKLPALFDHAKKQKIKLDKLIAKKRACQKHLSECELQLSTCFAELQFNVSRLSGLEKERWLGPVLKRDLTYSDELLSQSISNLHTQHKLVQTSKALEDVRKFQVCPETVQAKFEMALTEKLRMSSSVDEFLTQPSSQTDTENLRNLLEEIERLERGDFVFKDNSLTEIGADADDPFPELESIAPQRFYLSDCTNPKILSATAFVHQCCSAPRKKPPA
eukprot:TRINITY_DN56158_c0_g1_i4.p1 TRINITY_DN56158_c0_g1~~TRINITY_DN56158_c0_g1_i4.p1  ORF type:complete len:558 (-),score=152.43 TRINITY_DN56158_c0_g1_i4:1083-2756(-)